MKKKPARDKRGRLLPGHTANPGGRPKGAVSSLTAQIKEVIEEATSRAGEIYQRQERDTVDEEDQLLQDMSPAAAYLTVQAQRNPQAFLGLLAKIMPKDINISPTMGAEMVTTLQSRRAQLAAMKAAAIDAIAEEAEDDDEHED